MSARHDARRTATQFPIEGYLRKDASIGKTRRSSCVMSCELVETGCSPPMTSSPTGLCPYFGRLGRRSGAQGSGRQAWDEFKWRGLLDAKDTGGLAETARKKFQRAKASLFFGPKPRLFELNGLIWR